MGIDEAVETIAGILFVLGVLPFVMARLVRTLEEPKPARTRCRRQVSCRPDAGADGRPARPGRV